MRELGAGRFSRSWLAEDADGRPFVLKLLRRHPADAEAVERFLEEAARLVAAPELDHPNVARPVAAGDHAGRLFLVYDSGGEATLADELRQSGRVLPARALELCAQLCEGLAAAHRAGVLHRDLKPANVGLTRLADGSEQAVLLDVATSHLLAGIGLREEGSLPLSSAAYLSPEEAAGRPSNPRSDLYAAGVLLFQLISGRLPVQGVTAEELVRAHRGQRPVRLRDAGRKVHDDLETLMSRLLAKDPAHRPATADELAASMRALAAVADCAPEDDVPGQVDDPLPIDPWEPAQGPARTADAAPERSSEVFAEPVAPHPRAAARTWFAVPRWAGPATAAAGTLAGVVLVLQLWRPAGGDAPAPELAATTAMPPPAEAAPPQAAPD
ncbi:MAG TPA: serine/threonine-protein kinase, partial [Myxococcales bacterium]